MPQGPQAGSQRSDVNGWNERKELRADPRAESRESQARPWFHPEYPFQLGPAASTEVRSERRAKHGAGAVEPPIEKRGDPSRQIRLQCLDDEAQRAAREPRPPEGESPRSEKPSERDIEEEVREGVGAGEGRLPENEGEWAPVRGVEARDRIEARVDEKRQVPEQQQARDTVRSGGLVQGSRRGRSRTISCHPLSLGEVPEVG